MNTPKGTKEEKGAEPSVSGFFKFYTCPLHNITIKDWNIFNIGKATKHLIKLSPCNKCEHIDQCNLNISNQASSINKYRAEINDLIFSSPPQQQSSLLTPSTRNFLRTPIDHLQPLKVAEGFHILNNYDMWQFFIHRIDEQEERILTKPWSAPKFKRNTSKYDNCTESITIEIDEPKVKDKSRYINAPTMRFDI